LYHRMFFLARDILSVRFIGLISLYTKARKTKEE